MILAECSSRATHVTTVTSIQIPSTLPTRALLPDAYSYSLEPVWVADYVESNLTTNLMSEIAAVICKPPAYRIGGTTSDETYTRLAQNFSSVSSPNSSSISTFNVSAAWYQSWANYFPDHTDFVYTLNFVANSSAWAEALLQAETVHSALGDKLKLLELGNEVDHYIAEDWRAAGWDVAEYVSQWRNASDQIVASDWYQRSQSPPKFQAAVFADPPEVIDQQDEIDNFDIVNLTAAGLVDPSLISTYSVHLYPQSTCDTGRWYRMSLDLLSNHTVLWQNVSQYIPQVAAADAAKSPLVFGETNSVSCSGRSGISDTFGAALWGVDYVLMAASLGIEKVYFHLGAQSEYSSFVPMPYYYKNESLSAGIRAPFYGHYFLAHAIAGNESLSVGALPSANSSDLSGYGIYSVAGLQKLVFLNVGVWNGTTGLHNPSTLSTTDGTIFSNGKRPVHRFDVHTPWPIGSNINVLRLNGPGTNAKSLVNVSGVAFDPTSGDKIHSAVSETLTVGRHGVVSFDMEQASGILVELKNFSNSTGRIR
ncbi:glycoside hydrolase superfamily [Delphinella strobiligena]|nr:glycoside hydrolase superfamily [Delphinella strobiligena]